MTIDRAKMRWNGWGWTDHPDPTESQPAIWTRMAAALAMPALLKTPPRALESVTLPPSRLSESQTAQLTAIVGAEHVRGDAFDRATHARGRSYRDLLYLRAGRLDQAPDAVVYPANKDDILKLLRLCENERIAVVPFGGGSSVVGGVTAAKGEKHAAVIALDTTRINRIIAIDDRAMTATIEAGIWGVDLEAKLQAAGYTLGHYPQSFEFSTLGGWIAARGAGQQSNRYGKAEYWFVSARVVTPKGVWASEGFPASAAGPRLGDLIVGSEGTLGVIADATVKIHRVPQAKDYRGFLFRDFGAGVEAIRTIVQRDIPSAMLRLSDADETYFFQAFSTSPSKGGFWSSLAKRYVAARGYAERPCLFLAGAEGNAEDVAAARRDIAHIVKEHGGLAIGSSPGARWYHGRFASPYLRDPMMDNALGIDTLETATPWPNIARLYEAVRAALDDAMRRTAPATDARGLVFAHVSHAYPDGASLYFTYIFPRDVAREVEQWREIKRAASDAILKTGGTISHHHGVGEDHAPWIEAEKGAAAMSILRALKRELDPNGILNPGKLIP